MPSDDTTEKNSDGPQGEERDMKPLLFDAVWYLQQNADVVRARLDPVQHYLEYGAAEGRNPNAFFDTRRYLAANADVRGSPMNPFLHFVLYGFREGRDPAPPLKAAPAKEPEKAPPREMVVLAPPEPPTEEKLRQTLLKAMFTAAAETSGNDNRKGGAFEAPAKASSKPSPRPRSGARKRP